MPFDRRAAQLLATSCEAVIDAAERHMPPGPYRDFTAWAFSIDNPQQGLFLQTSGLMQIVNLNIELYDGVVADDDWPTMLHYAGQLSTYLAFEVISGNLCLGLGRPLRDEADLDRLTLVTGFNSAVRQALASEHRLPAVIGLSGPSQQAARLVSGFDQSHVPTVHAAAALAYAGWCADIGRPVPPRQELEYGLWSALVANVEICRELVDGLTGTMTMPLLRQGLIDRYQAVDRTLLAPHLGRLELAALGTQTSLVGPTLAYQICILYEVLAPLAAYPSVLNDGSLADTLADAALIVRLQNDIGPHLLRMAPSQLVDLMQTIARGTAEAGCITADEALDLLRHVGLDDPAFTRLDKDLLMGENNVALWHARRAMDALDSLDALSDSLTYYAHLYRQHKARLRLGLATLDARLGDRRASTVIERFVLFHHRMYGQRHTEKAGEYAI
jgi:hypothetical protein